MKDFIILPACAYDFKNIPDALSFCFYCRESIRKPDKSAQDSVRWDVNGFSHNKCVQSTYK